MFQSYIDGGEEPRLPFEPGLVFFPLRLLSRRDPPRWLGIELAELVDSAGELLSWAKLSRKAAVSPSVKLKWDNHSSKSGRKNNFKFTILFESVDTIFYLVS